MRASLLLFALLAVGLSVACLAAQAQGSDDVTMADASPQVTTTNEISARGKFQLPKLFDFQRFKSLFNKHYGSLLEELARKKVFLARAFKAFVSSVSYKLERASSFLSVNFMSDWTPEERRKSMIHSRIISGKLPKAPARDSAQPEVGEELVPAVSEEDIERALEEVERLKQLQQPGYKELAEEFEAATGGLKQEVHSRKRRATGSRRRELSPDDLMRAPEVGPEPEGVQRKIAKGRVASNNPMREPPEFQSFGAEDTSENKNQLSMTSSVANWISNIPGSSWIGSVITSAAFKLTGTTLEDNEKPQEYAFVDAPDSWASGATSEWLPDEVFVDHRQSNCFLSIRNQGKCGSCYAFATVSLYEWLYCRTTGHLVAFSEQYIVDCGSRTGLDGCEGGSFIQSGEFVDDYGLEMRTDYPYRMRDDQCPYELTTSHYAMGYIKLASKGFGAVKIKYFARYLKKSPILFGLNLNENFRDYGGGVDDNLNCKPEDGHAMLIVGHGREDGREYFLFRNSHSLSWGEQGYYKLSTDALERCSGDDSGYVSLGNFRPNDPEQSNPHYAGKSKLKRQYRDYLMEAADPSGKRHREAHKSDAVHSKF